MLIKDIGCTKDTPVVLGYIDKPLYGKGKRIRSRVKRCENMDFFRSFGKVREEVMKTGRIQSRGKVSETGAETRVAYMAVGPPCMQKRAIRTAEMQDSRSQPSEAIDE